MPATFTRFPSPLGELILTASDTALTGVHFPTSRHVPPLHGVERRTAGEDDGDGPASALLARARHQLDEYFARTRTTFDVPLDPPGTTFQRVVWDLLRTIPYGTTTSYGKLARRLATPAPPAPWAPPTARTRFRSSSPVTAWSGRAAS